MPDYTNTYEQGRRQKEMANDEQQSALFRALMGNKHADQMQAQQQQHDMAKQAEGSRLKGAEDQSKIDRDLQTVQRMQEMGLGKRSIKAGELSVAEPTPPNPLMQMRFDEKKKEYTNNKIDELSKRTQKTASTTQAAKQMEDLTNVDGRGGVLTNPNAELPGSGSIASSIRNPTLVALGERFGFLPKGTQEVRAAQQAVVNDYAHDKYGARVTPEQMQREYIAHGLVPGADPKLAAKAMRQRMRDAQSGQKSMEAGYDDEVRKTYHDRYPNPLTDMKIYDDSANKPGLKSFVGGVKHPSEMTDAELQAELSK